MQLTISLTLLRTPRAKEIAENGFRMGPVDTEMKEPGLVKENSDGFLGMVLFLMGIKG